MGTRGAFGFYINGETKVVYNHWDSYPTGLGSDVSEWAGTMPGDIRDAVKALQPLPDRPPTSDEIERLKPWTDLDVASRSTSDWYCLLRGTQGDLSAMLEAGLYKSAESFLADSLFCEWAYIINLDDSTLEVYRGFQEGPHTSGRYANAERECDNGYHPVALVKTYPLGAIPSDWANQAEAEAYPDDGE